VEKGQTGEKGEARGEKRGGSSKQDSARQMQDGCGEEKKE